MAKKLKVFHHLSRLSTNNLFTLSQLKEIAMNEMWWTLGKILNGAWFYDNIGDLANWSFIALGFFGFGYWMRWQSKFNKQAAENPDQLK